MFKQVFCSVNVFVFSYLRAYIRYAGANDGWFLQLPQNLLAFIDGSLNLFQNLSWAAKLLLFYINFPFHNIDFLVI